MRKLKENVVYDLEQNRGQVLSGQMLAERHAVSRAAVWKAVQSLRQEGHEIEAVPGGGYRLISDRLSVAGVQAHLEPIGWMAPVFLLEEATSTNEEAFRLLSQGAPHGTMVLAGQQTAGRGRRGKPFFSPPDAGLYMSLLLTPKTKTPTKVTVAAAVAVCRALAPWSRRAPEIKWVNDVYLDGKKAAGILTEAYVDVERMEPQSVVLGIGINITPPEGGYPSELDGTITSLFPEENPPETFSRCLLAAEIAKLCAALCEDLDDPALMEEYRERSFLLGKEITYLEEGAFKEGMARGINEAGNLLVETREGIRVLQAGEVSVRKGKQNEAAWGGSYDD
ncbi:MAG: biotin--[acetyl-CoA-carboxylase] ligase [Oscillospiraceae bacterium]